MSDSLERLLQPAKHGFVFAIVSSSHLSELQEEIGGRLEEGELDREFFEGRLSWFRFTLPEDLKEARSLIVVAVPRPQTQATFILNGKSRSLILPPTYTAYDETRGKIEGILAEALGREGYKVARTFLPLKLLAVRSGLAEYGRNNICYVPGMGSFLELVAVYSDLPCRKDQWREVVMMRRCESCQLCRQVCPTGAIPSDRFLLKAEKCIAYHNEKQGDIPFPDWMEWSWHNCLIGCLHCQRACPENRRFLKWIEEKEEFSEEETRLLMEGVPSDQLPKSTIAKLERLSLTEYLETLPRNLNVFFKQTARTH